MGIPLIDIYQSIKNNVNLKIQQCFMMNEILHDHEENEKVYVIIIIIMKLLSC